MSRIGKKTIPLPKEVSVSVKDGAVHVQGPKGALDLELPDGITLERMEGAVRLLRAGETRSLRALHGLVRSLVNNMVTGVHRGFEKRLQVVGVGYTARLDGRTLILNVGFCQPVQMPLPDGIDVEIPKRTNNIILTGVDKQKVGQFAAEVRAVRPPEPYKGKGIRYEDEFIRRKAGKSIVGGAK